MFVNHSHFCSSTKPPKNLSLSVYSSFSFVCLHLLAHVYCLLSACSFILVHLQFFCWSKGRKTGPVLFTKALKKRTRRAVWVFSFYVRRLPFPTVLSKVNHSDMLLLYFASQNSRVPDNTVGVWLPSLLNNCRRRWRSIRCNSRYISSHSPAPFLTVWRITLCFPERF